MIQVQTRPMLSLLLGIVLPFLANAQYNPTYAQNGSTNNTLAEVKTANAGTGTATFILLGDGNFRLGEGDTLTRRHNYPKKDTSYTTTAYFVRKYKDDPPTIRMATVNTGSGGSNTTNPNVFMSAGTKIGTSWLPSPGKKHFTILSFSNTCSDSASSGTIKFYYTTQQHFSTAASCLKVYNNWISSASISASDDSQFDSMLVASYTNLGKGEIRHIYLYGLVDNSVSVGDPIRSKLKITGIGCGVTESSSSVDAEKYPHDPNSKRVDQESVCSINLMPHTLMYRVSFHNDGEHFANNVFVSDNFDPRLLWPTAILSNSSHFCQHTAGPIAQFDFPAIQLPGLNQTSPQLYTYDETIGWFEFTIGTITCLPPFDVIRNKATVVFDSQLPITTTEAKTTLTESSCSLSCPTPRSAENDSELAFSTLPNPVSDQLQITFTPRGAWHLNLFSLQGNTMYQQSGDPAQSAQVITLDTHNWTPGMYLLHWQDQQETRSVKIIKI